MMKIDLILGMIAGHQLEMDNVFSAGNQKFINVSLMADKSLYRTVELTNDEKAFSDQLAFARDYLKSELSCEKTPIEKQRTHMVMGDIKPYISMIDGSRIESRSKHRTHLKDHGCIEIGNETKYLKHDKPLQSPKGLKEKLIHEVNTKLRSQL